MPYSTGSESTFCAVENWLEDCLMNHDDCARSVLSAPGSRQTGTRFLKIEEDRLLLLEDINPMRYICLSHCWGGGEGILRTTDSNYHGHSEFGVTMSNLPATFRDAVQICRLLKVSYLWIDSLCIIQDSDEDWRNQSAKMADIYANAFLTVAASASENATKGFFRTVDPSFVGEPLPGNSGVYVRLLTNTWNDTWPLLRRAWVFQELVLSSRVVHFGPNEVIWQCQHAVKSQGRQSKSALSKSIRDLERISRMTKDSQSENPDLANIWRDMVALYSQRSLTYSKDRLPAIAAIARMIQSLRPDDEYIAGIWRSSLCLDMLWHNCFKSQNIYTEGQLAAVKQRMAGDIPTWSWASTNTEVGWMRAGHPLSTVEILGLCYKVHGPAVSGKIIEAAITIRCPLTSYRDVRHRIDVQISLVEALYEDSSSGSSKMTHEDPRWDDVGWGRHDTIQAELFLLFLTQYQNAKYSSGQRALVTMETDHPGCYVRLGVVQVHYAGWWVIKSEPYDPQLIPDQGWHMQRYNTRSIAMLEEMDTQVVTLV
jgi:hypothetical protein